ncbi:MAG TPA: hypothetical protein VFP80_05375, partial [Thermoanaerobaculia bacterium]|nr:hypothetical protein [Thermoanaerobaculia bacterium]
MANDTAFRAGRFLQGQVTQDFSGCGPGNPQESAGAAAAVTGTIECNPSAIDACPTMKGCQTVPPTGLCTPVPEFCPTACGPECQTPQPNCTSINCTQVGPQCPEPTIGITCTSVPPQCPRDTNMVLDCTFGCTQFGPDCPVTPFPQCANVTMDASCQTVNAQQAVGAAGGGGGVNITLLTMPVWACGPTPATRCFICPPMTYDYNCQLQQQAVGGAAAAPGAWPTPATRCFVCEPVAAR